MNENHASNEDRDNTHIDTNILDSKKRPQTNAKDRRRLFHLTYIDNEVAPRPHRSVALRNVPV
jgi:hypothetical protein